MSKRDLWVYAERAALLALPLLLHLVWGWPLAFSALVSIGLVLVATAWRRP